MGWTYIASELSHYHLHLRTAGAPPLASDFHSYPMLTRLPCHSLSNIKYKLQDGTALFNMLIGFSFISWINANVTTMVYVAHMIYPYLNPQAYLEHCLPP